MLYGKENICKECLCTTCKASADTHELGTCYNCEECYEIDQAIPCYKCYLYLKDKETENE